MRLSTYILAFGALSHSKSHFIGLEATVPGPSPVLKGFGARQLQRHCWSGFAIGASHSFPAAEQRVQAGQQFETAEAFRAGTVLSFKAGERQHQSSVSQSKACFGSSIVKGQKQVGAYSVHYSGGTTRHHGVALALSQAASKCLQGCSPINKRIITATFHTALTPLTVIQVYAPTNCATPDVKDAFYQQLQQQLEEVPNANLLLLMGNFNAKLGCEAHLWGGAIGRFGLPAPITDNGTRLLHLCMANNLVVTDTIFQHKPVHLQTWYSPNATDSTKHQIDHVLFRRRDIKAVQDTRVFRGADIESDHRLMLSQHHGTGSAEATSKATETLGFRGNASPCQQQEQIVASFTGQPYSSGQG
ncbi:hypothetical protein WJX79_005630 [Trebouxia sp. C0005]